MESLDKIYLEIVGGGWTGDRASNESFKVQPGERFFMPATRKTSLGDCTTWIAQQLGVDVTTNRNSEELGRAFHIKFLLGEFGCRDVLWFGDSLIILSYLHGTNETRSADNAIVADFLCHDLPILCVCKVIEFDGALSIHFVDRGAVQQVRLPVRMSLSKPKDLLNLFVPFRQDRLFKSGKALENARTFAEQGVQDGDEFDASYGTICIQTLTGKKIQILAELADTIGQVMQQVREKEGIPEDQQRLIYEGRQMEIGRTLASYNVSFDDTIHLVLRLRGGGSYEFVDVNRQDAVLQMEWSNSAPCWRMAKKGLCLEGKCTTSECVAFHRMVIVNMGFANFDLVQSKERKLVCPACQKASVTPIKPGFNNCLWRIISQKTNAPNVISRTTWNIAANSYTTFDEVIAGTAEFSRLQIFVKRVPPGNEDEPPARLAQEVCMVCLDSCNSLALEEFTNGCGHRAHPNCLLKQPTCLMCHPVVPVQQQQVDLTNSHPPPTTDESTHHGNNLLSSSSECVVCWNSQADHVVVPCGHICLCQGCASPNNISAMGNTCPLCKGIARETFRVFHSGRMV